MNQDKEQIRLLVDQEVKEKLRTLAEKDNRSMSNFLVVLIEKAWDEKQAEMSVAG